MWKTRTPHALVIAACTLAGGLPSLALADQATSDDAVDTGGDVDVPGLAESDDEADNNTEAADGVAPTGGDRAQIEAEIAKVERQIELMELRNELRELKGQRDRPVTGGDPDSQARDGESSGQDSGDSSLLDQLGVSEEEQQAMQDGGDGEEDGESDDDEWPNPRVLRVSGTEETRHAVLAYKDGSTLRLKVGQTLPDGRVIVDMGRNGVAVRVPEEQHDDEEKPRTQWLRFVREASPGLTSSATEDQPPQQGSSLFD